MDNFGIDHQYSPAPASKFLPEWYKQTPEYVNGEKNVERGNISHTIKKCIPVFDSLTAGYIIPTYVDVFISEEEGAPYYQWPQFNAISFHPIIQAEKHPSQNGVPYPKWINPWSIQTPPGYSTLFVPPLNNPNKYFTIIPGIVDTDQYSLPINFPFVLNDVSYRGMIPAGTPMVQAIPFKRDGWTHSIGYSDAEETSKKNIKLRSVWFNSYKKQFWSRKEWR